MNNDLRKLQLVQLDLLLFVDGLCRQHHLSYSLYAGTLLGAVRHQGFIPWDDDLDICMPRADYNRFLELWPQVEHSGYILQNKENTPAFTQSFTKIRKDHSTFLQDWSEAGRYHTGIFIDIFPIDRIPNGRLPRLKYTWDCLCYQLYTREFAPTQYGALKRMVASLLLLITPKRQYPQKRRKLLAHITRYDGDFSCETVAVETLQSIQKPFSATMLDHYTSIEFEGHRLMCFSEWQDHLRRKYGNYMQLPPEDQREWKHHPVVLDFEHNYEERPRESGE